MTGGAHSALNVFGPELSEESDSPVGIGIAVALLEICWPHRVTRGLDQNGRCLFNLIGRMVDLFELLRQPVVQHRKPFCVVDSTSRSAVHVERFKEHGNGSSLCACRRHDLQQSPSGCFRMSVFGPNTAAKGEADREPAAFVEHRLRLFERKFCSLHALPGDRLFQNHKFNHYAASSRFAIPSKGEPWSIPLVPGAYCRAEPDHPRGA